jgi:hypothetical protein
MPINLTQYRQVVGVFANIMRNQLITDRFTCFCVVLCISMGADAFVKISLLLLCCGDIHPNPGPDENILKVMHLKDRYSRSRI